MVAASLEAASGFLGCLAYGFPGPGGGYFAM
jgi:hypothetical protein